MVVVVLNSGKENSSLSGAEVSLGFASVGTGVTEAVTV